MYVLGKLRTSKNRCADARSGHVGRHRTRHCTARGISAAAYAPPFTVNRLPKKVEQQTTSALFTRRATLRLHCPAVKRPRFAFYAYNSAAPLAIVCFAFLSIWHRYTDVAYRRPNITRTSSLFSLSWKRAFCQTSWLLPVMLVNSSLART